MFSLPHPAAVLLAPAIAAINHLLAQDPAARQQLARHAGKVASVDTGLATLRMAVSGDGYVVPAAAGAVAQVTIRVKLADLPLIAQNRERAFSYVRIEGDAEFANLLSQLSKTVRWDAEHDLERLVGPVAAVRLVAGAHNTVAALGAGQRKVAEHVAEYFLDEQPLLVRPVIAAELATAAARLRDDVERLGKRLAKLEHKLPPPSLDEQ